MRIQFGALGLVILMTMGVTKVCRHQPDAAHGLDRLQHGVYQDPLLCSAVFDDLKTTWDGPDRELANKATTVEELRAIGRARYGLAVAPYSNDGVPMGFVKSGTAWHMNCLLCHGGQVPGRPPVPTIGVGNNRLDLQTLFEDLDKYDMDRVITMCAFPSAPVPVHANSAERPRMFGLSFSGGAPAAPTEPGCHPPAVISRARGTTTAFIQSAILLQYRDKNMEQTACEPITDLQDHDLDAPAWWTTARKQRLYSDGFAPDNPRALLQFAMSRLATGSMLRGWENDARDMLAWIDSTKAPAYPFSIDTALAHQGRTTFESRCAQCHGTYGNGSDYPEKRAIVGTDGLRLVGLSASFKRRYADSWLGNYGRGNVEITPTGYVAPPLNGLWATAPYFHNGSVPTLEHVLNSPSRPTVWRVTDFDTYDEARAGLRISEHVTVPPTATVPSERRRYVNTGIAGLSNSGHTFGDALTAAERKALIEYLKSL